MDKRQPRVQVDDYGADIGKDLPGLRIGVIGEGFGHENSEADVNAAAVLAQRGAEVENINIPMHAYGFSIWSAFVHDGGYWAMQTNRMRLGSQPPVWTGLPDNAGNWQQRADEMSDPLKIMALFGAYRHL